MLGHVIPRRKRFVINFFLVFFFFKNVCMYMRVCFCTVLVKTVIIDDIRIVFEIFQCFFFLLVNANIKVYSSYLNVW